jgi:DUF4097 and DUF4098 domain-containing protein YvlB
VPEASELEVRTVSARIEVDGVGGRQRLVTVSGEVTSALDANGVEAETVSGDLTILGSGQSSQSTLRSVSGSIVTEHLSGDLDASSISGGIEARTALLERARLHSTSGDIELAGGLAPDGRLELSTTSGDVDVRLDHDRDLDVDAQSFSGDIDNCFGMETSRSRYSSERSLRFRVGEANRTLRIRSMSGSIDICSERRSG